MEGLELICFQIISSVGTARSIFIEAIREAKDGNIKTARNLMNEGAEIFKQGHHTHLELIQKEAAGEKTDINLLLIHTEDLLMSAESFSILAAEFIDMYEKIYEKQ